MIGNFTMDVKVYIFNKIRQDLPKAASAGALELHFGPLVRNQRTNWDNVRVTVKQHDSDWFINQYPLDYDKKHHHHEDFQSTCPAIWRWDETR